jgi:hypothetical protein
MKTLTTLSVIGLLCGTVVIRADQVVKPDPWTSQEYSVLAVEGRFAAYIGFAPVILDSKLRDKNPKTYLEAIERFGPAFTSRLSSVGTWEWHFDDGMIYRVQPNWSGPLSTPVALKLEKTYLQIIPIEKTKAEGAAGQPATRPEAKPEGNQKPQQKPQPKSEGRSRKRLPALYVVQKDLTSVSLSKRRCV